MKTILENFLDALDISYTKRFTRNLFEEHPHKNNMYGLKKMLDVYGVNTLGVYVEKKKLSELNFPCILSCSYTDGHSCVCIGYCQVKYEQQGSKIIAISSCV